MPISFSQIPSNIKVPLYWVEVDPSMAGLPVIVQPSLIVGTMIAPGDAAPNVPIVIGSQAQADAHFGPGSELSRMFKAFFANNFANMVYGLPLSEPVGAVKATGVITVTAPCTEAGTIHLYIAGDHIPINIQTTQTIDQIAQAITDAINDLDQVQCPVTAVKSTGGIVTLTAVWKGIGGNEITVGLNYYGSVGGDMTPVGLGITMPATGQLTGGTGTPVMDTAIANLGEQEFEFVAMPFTDSNSLFAWEEEYGFSDQGRWGWQRQHFGHIFSAKRGTYSALVTFGQSRNSGVTSVLGFEVASPSPSFEWCAAYTAKAQRSLTNDPARPLQTLSLNKIKLAPLHQRFDFVELNSLALSGIAIQKAGSDNQPMLAREQTTYQLNLYGMPDDAYELVTTLATLARLLRNQRHAVTSKFPRHKLADDGTRFGPGQAIVTPGIIKGELVSQYRQDEYNGLVENASQFIAHLIVERDPNDPNRVNVLYPPDLINQLRIFAVLAQFRLQYDRGVDREIVAGANLGVTGTFPSAAPVGIGGMSLPVPIG
jgi:phage tail sheath gpL-like